MKKGTKVKYLGAIPEQIKWGNNDDPRPLLDVGSVYEVAAVKECLTHIKIQLTNYHMWFNAVSFKEIK